MANSRFRRFLCLVGLHQWCVWYEVAAPDSIEPGPAYRCVRCGKEWTPGVMP